MKVKIIIGLLVLINQSYSIAAPSIEESMEWIIGKMETDFCLSLGEMDDVTTDIVNVKLRPLNSNINTYVYNYVLEQKNYRSSKRKTTSRAYEDKFSLADTVSVTSKGPNTSTKKNKNMYRWDNDLCHEVIIKSTRTITMYFTTKEMAERIKKAFEHAVKLAKEKEIF